jgi:hypothetical protein
MDRDAVGQLLQGGGVKVPAGLIGVGRDGLGGEKQDTAAFEEPFFAKKWHKNPFFPGSLVWIVRKDLGYPEFTKFFQKKKGKGVEREIFPRE